MTVLDNHFKRYMAKKNRNVTEQKDFEENLKLNVPHVIIIGTSNIDNIDTNKLSSKFTAEKLNAYTLEETETTVSELEFTTKPDAFVLHSVTNDIKTHSPQDCVDKMEDIIQVLKGKFASTKIIISLPTPRLDNSTVNNKSFQLNDEAIYMCDNSNLAYKGEALKRYVGDDDVHLTSHVVSHFASNIRDTIDGVLRNA